MILSTWSSVVAFLVAAIASGMACVLFARKRASSSHRSIAALLGTTAVASLANGLGVLDETRALFWRETAMVAELLQPAALLYVGLAFLNPAEQARIASGVWRARIIGVVGLLLAALILTGQVFQWKAFEYGQVAIALAPWGRLSYVFMVIGMALGVAQLELVLRASREPIRHKLKFIVIGLAGVAGFQIYQASQMLLFPVWQVENVLVSSVVTTLSLCLIAYGLARSRLRDILVNTYVSQQALFGSVTFIGIGLYLLAVGIVGEWLRQTNRPLGGGLSVVVIFGALVVLAIVIFSKTVRAEIRRFLARNFHRSKYDYRAQWLQVTEAFHHAVHKDAIMDCLLDLLINNFPTTTISIWSFREADRRFCQVRSMTNEKEPAPLELSHPIIVRLGETEAPLLLEDGLANGSGENGLTEDPLAASKTALCLPIRARGQLTAFVALGKQLHGEAYGTDDCDLLFGISHHVGTLLSNASLAEERQASAELEALHRFSVFCLHDLKNLAARLSLVAQNAKIHSRNPAFQESAMRAVTDTAEKMTALLSKLSVKSFEPTIAGVPEMVKLPSLVEEIVAPIRGEGMVRLRVVCGQVQPVMVVREQIHQVLLNVVLNAKQAIGETGDLSIAIEQSNGSVVVTVEDTGSGIPSSMLGSLFQPSQSSRPGGLGIGLYQCKQIVEAHRGAIQIRSQVGKGTQVRIELPLSRPAEGCENNVKAHSIVSSYFPS